MWREALKRETAALDAAVKAKADTKPN